MFGYFKTKNVYPKTYVHKETITEKLTDLFLKHDVDFEHSKKFSRSFQVITEDKQRLQDLLQLKDLDALTAYPEMELEFDKSSCLFRSSRKGISIKEASYFCEMAKTLITMFS